MTDDNYSLLLPHMKKFFIEYGTEASPEEWVAATGFINSLQGHPPVVGVAPEVIEADPPQKSKPSPTRSAGLKKQFLKNAVTEGPAPIPVLVERLLQAGMRLPTGEEERHKHVYNLLKKSPHTYRLYPDGAWGLLRQRAPKLVSSAS